MTFKERFINGLFRFLIKATCKLDMDDFSKIPLKGPGIIISNHTTAIEGPLYYVFLRPRRTVALAKKELWNKAFTRAPMEAWGAIPVDRGALDMKALRACFGVLEEGNFLCIAPEGTRSKDGALGRGKPGTTFFASKEEVPIYPLAQWGLMDWSKNLKRLKRTSVHVRTGDPFIMRKPGGGKLTSEDRQAMADEMMRKIAELLPEELRGRYAGTEGEPFCFIRAYEAE